MAGSEGLIAIAEATIDAPINEVWRALTDPALIEQYMFGTTVVTDWTEGGEIRWKGVWKGTSYEDKGTVLRFDEPHRLQYTHFSPMTGQADIPENYHTVAIELSNEGGSTRVRLRQDNNPTEDAREHSERNWRSMLISLKSLLEGQ